MPAPQVSAANFTSATNTGLAMQNAVNNGQPVNPNNQPNVNTNPTATNAYTGQTFSTLPSTNNSSPATTTPIVSANAATQDYLTKKAATDQIAQGVAQQAKNNAQNQVNTATNTTSGIFASQGGNQPTTGQNTNTSQNSNQNGTVTAQSDNSDLTSALSDATAALNAGNGIQAPDQNAENQTQAGYQQQEQDVQNQLSNINDQIQSAVTNYQSSLNQIQNGTFPLTPAQQGLLQQTQSAVASLTQSAQQTAQLYAQGAQTFGAVHGLAEFNPGAAMQAVTAAAAKGAAAVADAQFKGIQALSDLQKNIADEDTSNITDSYDALTKNLDSQQASLEKMSSDIQTQAKDAQDQFNTEYKDYQTGVQDSINDAIRGQQLTDTEGKNAFDNYMSQANLTEKEKQDATDNYFKSVTAGQNQQKIDLQQQKINTDLLNSSESAVNSKVTTPDGKTYVDGTNLDAASKAAAISSGAPVLTGDNAKAMSSITNVQGQVSTLLSTLQQAGVVNAQGQFTGNKAGNWLTRTLDIGGAKSAEQAAGNFGTSVKSIVSDLQKLPGTGELVATLNDNIPGNKDSLSTLASKIKNIKSALTDSENSLLLGGSQPQTYILNGKTLTLQPDGTYE